MYVISRAFEYRPDGMRITVCTVGEEFVAEFARGTPEIGRHSYSPADGSMAWPTSLAFDQEWNVYVADEWLNRISLFTKDGKYLGKWGEPGQGAGELNRPSGLAFDRDDNLYVVDSCNHRIQKFTRGGTLLSKWGQFGGEDGQFNLPWGIDIDREGNIYVADWRNDRVQKFSPDGQFLMKFGTPGSGLGEFHRPTSVAVDNEGIIYVADWGNDRVQVFDPDGIFLTWLTGEATMSRWGKAKLDANPEMWKERQRAQLLQREELFCSPIAVEVDDQNHLFVVESGRHRIQVYQKQVPIFVGPRL